MIPNSMLAAHRTLLALVLLFFTSVTIADTAIYKWQDENGKTVYGQTPPHGVKATIFKPAVHKGNPEEAQKKLKEDVEAFEKRRSDHSEEQDAQAVEARNQEILKQNCEIAKKNLDLLQARGQVNLKEGDTYRALPEEERQAKIEQANKHIEEYCNQAP